MAWNSWTISKLFIASIILTSLDHVLSQKIDLNNTVSLILDIASNDANSTVLNFQNLFEFSQNASVKLYFGHVNQTAIQESNLSWQGKNGTVTLVNDQLVDLIEITTANEANLIQKILSVPTYEYTENETLKIFIDICSKKGGTKDLMQFVKQHIDGVYAKLQTKPSIANTSLAYSVLEYLSIDQPYFIKFENASIGQFWKLARNLCGNRNKNSSIDQLIDAKTWETCCCQCNSTNFTSSIDQNPICANITSNLTDFCDTNNRWNVTCCQNETDPIIVLPPHIDQPNTTTVNLTLTTQSIPTRSHSNMTLVFAAVIVLLAVIILGFVYRRRIYAFFSARIRSGDADREGSSMRYGTLKNREEFSGW